MDVLYVKVPVLLVEAYCVHKFMYLPNPPAKAEEQARYANDRKVVDPMAKSGPLAARNFIHISRVRN